MTGSRFITLADVADILGVSESQIYALVRRGDLPAIRIGGRGQWRVEVSEIQVYIDRMYEETRQFVKTHPIVKDDET